MVTDQASQQAIVEELHKRGIKYQQVPWTGRSNSGKSKAHRYGRIKTLVMQNRLVLVDSPELRQEFIEITVSPSASDPGYTITTHGPDDMADATVMAVTEALSPKRQPPKVHDFGPSQITIPSHQKYLSAIYGNVIPAHAIDR